MLIFGMIIGPSVLDLAAEDEGIEMLKELGVDAKIVMPTGTPNIKVQSVRNYGGNVVLHGDSFDDAQAHANELVREEGRTLVHPFDDPLVIAGQATVGMEILRERNGKPLDAIFVCCGGGGLVGSWPFA